MLKMVRYMVCIAMAVAMGCLVYHAARPEKDDIEVRKGRLHDIETMARLCSVDLYAELPVLDTINGKVLFAVQKQRGSVTFDMDQLAVDDSGDTVKITLPPERVQIFESTDPDSWEVIDTKAIGPLALLRSDRLNIRDENRLKDRIRQKAVRKFYDNGTVARARAQAARTLESLMGKIYRRPVTVIDPVTDKHAPGPQPSQKSPSHE